MAMPRLVRVPGQRRQIPTPLQQLHDHSVPVTSGHGQPMTRSNSCRDANPNPNPVATFVQ